ncbi:MAG TPA: AAA family ATPase [Rhizobiaceae bacterium]
MKQSFPIGGDGNARLLWEDGVVALCRGLDPTAGNSPVFMLFPLGEHPAPVILARLAHEFGLRDELDGSCALRPLELKRARGSTVLVLEDRGGDLLARLVGSPMEMGRFLPLAIGIVQALGKVHQHGLVHKDIKPANIVVDCPDGNVRLTGFGIASRLSRERQAPQPPETINGTLAYLAPEQTGRTNRSVDTRSDLYALGVTFYQMVTGALPFTASHPMEWVHCHIARKPVSPGERLEAIPDTVSAIIMKLLAKTPEDRYQTASGIERDLQRCLNEWNASRRIDAFPLGMHDTPDRLVIPERLYGREREISAILGCLDRVVTTGDPEFLLVGGYSGTGKSAVVHELHKTMVHPRPLFASGKFDQYQRDIPYATLVIAFRQLVHPLLSKSDADLAEWRNAFLEALGANARLMTELIPELKLIIGEPPPAVELPPRQAQVRFHLVFQRFIGVFARPEHPLALFLDDLQWLDVATLELLEDILTRSELTHLLLVGAYRNNEVGPDHPFARQLEAIKSAGGRVTEVTLTPLGREHVTAMISDALRCPAQDAAALADLVHEKTGGNPFFVLQFLTLLADKGMLAFDHEGSCWSWDIERIKAQRYTDNVVDLMVEKLARLPKETLAALQDLSCIGNAADMETLSLVLGADDDRVDAILWPARRLEFVERRPKGYRFTHDRVQEAAYSLLSQTRQAQAHLRIGRLLAQQTPREQREDVIFDIVNQLNRGTTLITKRDEREELAELNLIAGKRAKASAAYASALNYFTTGAALLSDRGWEARRDLAFALDLNVAECEFVTGSVTQANERLVALHRRALTLPESSAVTCLRGAIHVTLGQQEDAVAVALEYLREIGTNWSVHPTTEEAQAEHRRLLERLGNASIESLGDLPPMTDPAACATMEVLLQLAPPALPTDHNLLCLTVCRMANLSLQHGNSDGSSAAYIWLGLVLGPYFGDPYSGFRFASLGLDLVDKRGLARFRVRAYELFGGHVNAWTQHVREGRPMLQRAFSEANEIGDVTFAGYSCCNLLTNLLAAGDDLDAVQREAEFGLDYAREHKFSFVTDLMTPQRQLVRMLRGTLPVFGRFDAEDFSEAAFELRIQSHRISSCWYWIRKLQARFFAGSPAAGLEAALMAQPLLWTSASCLEIAEYHFYAALVRAALHDEADDDKREEHKAALSDHWRQLQAWAVNCPENFLNRAALVGAELARIEGRSLDAMHLYEKSIRIAEEQGFVHHQALANELAAQFYAGRGFETIARTYVREARHGYLHWGAMGKVRQLDEFAPYAREGQPASSSTSTAISPVESLDLATVIKVSQAISGETVHDRLIDTLLRTAMEHAGGEKAVLLLVDGADHRIVAHAATGAEGITVQSHQHGACEAAAPESVLRYVMRVRECVILDDALEPHTFSDDPYFGVYDVRSLLCLPLINRTNLIGMLLIENNLSPRVFTSERLAVLKLIALQAAISLENTRLYRDLEERESRIRSLVESDVICVVIWDLDGRLIDVNDAFLKMLQYDRADVGAGLNWFDMTPPDWQEVHLQVEAEELRATGAMRAREKEFFRKDGSRVPVLIGAAVFESRPTQGVAYILDLTDLKRAEAEARENEQRYRKVQMELAHANRISTMGQLTGSIAHEVNQPITATVINAQAALREIGSTAPDLGEVEDALKSIVKDGNRAGDIIARIRSLMTKSPPSEDVLEINEPILEVIELTRSEATKASISVHVDLDDDLPPVRGDRVQLQQVMLNLIINAVEAMDDSRTAAREVLIRTEEAEGGGVLVTVQDSGPGLPAAVRESAFEAFYTTKASGLGMGLSICRSIIEAHGGRVWANSNKPRGAIFQFTLPADTADAARDRPGGQDGAPGSNPQAFRAPP